MNRPDKQQLNLPILLTLTRLVLAPIIVPTLLVLLLPYNVWFINMALATIFAAFGMTDFFDGYFARKFGLESSLGRLLDPVADKLLVSSTLIALVAVDRLAFYWAVIWIAREFFVLSLRQYAAEHDRLALCVSALAKLKTALQLACLTFIILNPMHQYGLFEQFAWNGSELLLLLSSTILSVWSAYCYYSGYITHSFAEEETEEVVSNDETTDWQ